MKSESTNKGKDKNADEQIVSFTKFLVYFTGCLISTFTFRAKTTKLNSDSKWTMAFLKQPRGSSVSFFFYKIFINSPAIVYGK